MNLRLKALDLFFPLSLKRKKFRQLVLLTSNAFEVDVPDIARLPFDDALRAYALFTRDEALKSVDRRLLVKERLFEEGFELGKELRHSLKVNTREDVLNAARILYGMIKIDFRGKASGEIVVRRCYFDKFYSSEVCKTIASLDEGLLAGLSGGGELKFSQTITEGNAFCRGMITFKGLNNETGNRRGHWCWWCNSC
jgi:hypothetical protein